ncbi:hypothetical protein WME79_48455 [Sorangium sp. So ce726]|uniref:hypothetical protein n=1 Tax=Sorangium sp. So ce726 TaxID=3133319 RepID=UPI003F61EC2A
MESSWLVQGRRDLAVDSAQDVDGPALGDEGAHQVLPIETGSLPEALLRAAARLVTRPGVGAHAGHTA